MSGRDVIGIAKTGSGKTIAFLLPMFRHIKDQRPSQGQDGPIGLVMTPTRELALQIFKECKHFTKPLGLRVACCYGGAPIKDQIADLKRGADIIICTPGRMIDLLCANGGRVTNLKRVTYLVLDEADRMFDLGFEPQVMKMVANIRPDRQTILFSATFPRFMEALARKILQKPLEILVGARSVVASDVTQVVDILADDEAKFLRLLAILGKWSSEDPTAKFLIFVDRQEAADNMMSLLLKRGYPCLSLHGGKDQADRDSVIYDFKNNTSNILIATSVAARGLDVKDLKVVVNYDCPNHLEDYVHRCGRTGRAGNKGTAYTFILPDQGQYSVDIVKALTASNAEVPPALREMANKQLEKAKMGFARLTNSGFGGRGLNRLEGDRDSIRRIQARAHGADIGDDKDDGVLGKADDIVAKSSFSTKNQDVVPLSQQAEVQAVTTEAGTARAIAAMTERIARSNAMTPAERVQAMASAITRSGLNAPQRVQTDAPHWAEVEINDYPQKARWKVTSKEQISRISAIANAAITSRGVFVAPGKQAPPGERKLYLFIEGDSQSCIDRALQEIKDLLTEATALAMDDRQTIGRYSVL
ncbi:pre-mRNA processing RNA-helicase [Kappamyces sp. JEL0680]|nr:pre-mRNA processing RNA-helicase [Kappamyces sp. JEL0680]